jgi:hypothetical protein
MSPVDAAWLRMDSATNPMIINTVLLLDGAVPHAELERLLRDRLLPHARFRRRAVAPHVSLVPPRWEEDPYLDLASHLHRVALPAPADEGALAEYVSHAMSSPLDRNRPLWQVHHVEGLASGSALIARVHHALGDGVALVKLLLGLTDEGPKPPPPKVGVTAPRPATARDLARMASARAVSLARMLALPAEPQGPLKGPLGVRKRVAWSRPFDVAAIKRAAHAHRAKLNDIVVASVAGALRDYLAAHGSEQRSLRAIVPVYVPASAEGADMGNHFGLVYLPLPVDVADPEERIAQAKRAMDDLKRAPDALVAMAVLGAMGMASEGVERLGIDLFTRKASVLVTNVPGPPEALHLLGRRLSTLLVWAPVSGNVAVGVTLLSYAGTLRMGLSADARVVQDPAPIVAAFEESLGQALSRA